MLQTISGLVASYGYVVLFFLVALESLGIPLPGETALLTAAALAALGHLSIYAVVATAVAAAVIGDNGGYWIGRKGGIALVRRYGRRIHLNESQLDRARGFFERHGPKTVFIGRFIALLRTWVAVLAGTARMPYGSFMFYNALGGACCAVMCRAATRGRGWARGPAGCWLLAGPREAATRMAPPPRWAGTLPDGIPAHATPAGYAVFNAISLLGSPLVLTVLALAVALVLGVRRHWIVLGGWVAAFAGGGLLDAMLKLMIRRPRPPYAARFLPHYTWSFPSGHAMSALIGYGMLAYLLVVLWTHRRSAQITIVLGAAVLIVAIGLSRLYLGVHYFSDVVGGYAAGVLWLSTCISGLEVARRWDAAAPPAAARPAA